MNRLITFSLTALFVLSSSWAQAGQIGNAGDGVALFVTETGRRIHRELLMEPYDASVLQMRDLVPLEKLYWATFQTLVISTDEIVLDNRGLAVTAVYNTRDQQAAIWRAQRVPSEVIQKRLQSYPLGTITVNRRRFQDEMTMGLGIALKTVFHEYGRAIGMKEDFYEASANAQAHAFFQRLYERSSPVTKSVLSQAPVVVPVENLNSKFDLIDREQKRLKESMTENRNDLTTALAKRGEKVEAQKRAYTAYGRALADSIGEMGIVPMPFPSYAARVLRGQVEVIAEGMTLSQKMSETEVLNQQVRYLTSRLNAEADFSLELEQKRRELVMKALN